MSQKSTDESDDAVSRRTFMKASGVAAGAMALGVGATGSAAALGELDPHLLNWRRVEAKKVWDRGYRGRPDRTLAITDSGISARHPDLGPWNGVVASRDGDNLRLADAEAQELEYPDPAATGTTELATLSGSGTVGPGVADAGVVSRDVIVRFTPSAKVAEAAGEETQELEPTQLTGTLTWTPQRQDNELFLEKRVGDGEWEVVRSGTNFNPQSGAGESVTANGIEPDTEYRFVIETYINVNATYEFEGAINSKKGAQQPEIEFGPYTDVDPFEEIDYDPEGDDSVDPSTPKTVGWYNEAKRYSGEQRPRDPNGHGSHCAGIMSGTGEASVVDYQNTATDKPEAVLLPTETIEYEVDVRATSTVFASALGDNVRIEIVYDGDVVHQTGVRTDSIIADEPAVHDTGTETYTIQVTPYETDGATDEAAERAQGGNPTVGRLREIAYGSYKEPSETAGARVPGGNQSVHPGVAPNFSLVGLEGLGAPTNDLGSSVEFAEQFVDAFNARAVNMSWGYILGAPLGAAGGAVSNIPSALKTMTEAGLLPVAAAGNAMTPANGNGAPAGMDEPISVAATDPFDGLTPYSSGGIGSVDEDENDVDRKPDVTAPGGDVNDYAALLATALADGNVPVDVGYPIPGNYELARAVKAGDPNTAFEKGDPPRDYTGKGGTSMASPYVCGTTGLVAQAMEEDAPENIALDEPSETGFEDAMRLKQVVLATASETVFTAAPYHAAKSPPSAPTYTHGERDPYEGFGRVNPDAAVDAVSRDLLETDVDLGDEAVEVTHGAAVGTNIPVDSRAVAGYVNVPGGTLDVSLEFTGYSGANAGAVTDTPHLDLFVYDAETPAANGEPNIVTSTQALDGSGSVSLSVDGGDSPSERTFYVVAKLVDIPGAVNGFDVQANCEMKLSFDPAGSSGS